MNIVHVVTLIDHQQSYGGPVSVATTQCRALRERGHAVHIIGGWEGDDLPPKEFEGIAVTLRTVRAFLPGLRFSGLHSMKLALAMLAKIRQADIVHIHLARDAIPFSAAVMALFLGTPYVTQTHGMITPDQRILARVLDFIATRKILKSARSRICLTETEEGQIRAVAKLSTPVVRLFNSVYVPTLSTPRAQIPNVLFLARLHPRKRVRDFLDAAASIIEDDPESVIEFAIVGPDDGDLPYVKDAVSNAALKGRVRYEGSIPHDKVQERLGKAHAYVLPSDHEPFPMSLLEALAVGTPSICTSGCGVANLLAADMAAIVVEPGDVKSIASHIKAIVNDSEHAKALADAGKEAALRHFSPSTSALQLEQIYRAGLNL